MLTKNITTMLEHVRLLRLLQLVSPSLPVGAYAYSEGLEYAVEVGWVSDESETERWIQGQLQHAVGLLDIPVFIRLYRAFQHNDTPAIEFWSCYLLAARESAELHRSDTQMGQALARLLADLGVEAAQDYQSNAATTLATVFALACDTWEIPLDESCCGYLWAWAEAKVAAAIKLVPLGQTAGQRILSTIAESIPAVVKTAHALPDDEIQGSAPGLAMASARHESQYTRLFQS